MLCMRTFLRSRRALVLALFAAFFIVGLFSFKDYGLSADEPVALWYGYHTYGYLFLGGKVPDFQDWYFYGPIVHLAYAAVHHFLALTDGRDIYLLRHFLNFTIFFGAAVSFYCIARRCYAKKYVALVVTLFLMVSPRIFAHAFYNPKDLPALDFFILCTHSLFIFLEKKTVPRLLLHALLCGMLISQRAFGLLLPLVTVALVLWPRIRGKHPLKRDLLMIALYAVATVLFTIAVWPLLWHDPLGNFLGAFGNTTGRGGGGLYLGEYVVGTPWHYVFVWMGITVPLLYSAFFLLGCAALVIRAVKKHIVRSDIVMLAWFFAPIAALILLDIGIFNEWRHVFFLYPAFLLIAGRGIEWALERIDRRIVMAVITLHTLWVCGWMFARHPFEYMYFSVPTRFVAGNFEMDYWSVSYRAGLEWVLQSDRTPVLRVYSPARLAEAAADLLPLSGWARLEWVAPEEAQYVLAIGSGFMPEEKKLHAIAVDGITILSIYRGPYVEGASD